MCVCVCGKQLTLARLRVIVSKVHHRTAEAILALILIHEVPIFALRTQAIALALDAILQAGRFVAHLERGRQTKMK